MTNQEKAAKHRKRIQKKSRKINIKKGLQNKHT
jgi:hypothetical protein